MEWQTKGENKPHLFFDEGAWWCVFKGLCYGSDTPAKAYEITLKRVSIFSDMVCNSDEYALAA